MNEQITQEEFAETNRKMQELFHEAEISALKLMPLWMRLNYFGSKVNKAIADGHKNEDIKWDYINEMCTKDLGQFDYNMYQNVNTAEELIELRFNVICASEGVGPWQKHKCKDCGREFYMDYKEVHFYQEKGLSLPKRCKECREKRKNK